MQKNFPSVKTIMRIGDMDRSRSMLLRRVLKCTSRFALGVIIDANKKTFAETDKWWRRCYNEPSRPEIKMRMADEIIGGFGVEGVGEVDMHYGPPLEYVNLADAYDVTLCRFRGRYMVCSWGDIVERHERLFREG